MVFHPNFGSALEKHSLCGNLADLDLERKVDTNVEDLQLCKPFNQ